MPIDNNVESKSMNFLNKSIKYGPNVVEYITKLQYYNRSNAQL